LMWNYFQRYMGWYIWYDWQARLEPAGKGSDRDGIQGQLRIGAPARTSCGKYDYGLNQATKTEGLKHV
jgi:hypothetical protein